MTQRAHHIRIEAGGDTKIDMLRALKDIIFHLERGDVDPIAADWRKRGETPSTNYMFYYEFDPSMTQERYFAEKDAEPSPPAITRSGNVA